MAPAIVISGIGKRNSLLKLLDRECVRHGAELVGLDAADPVPARLAVKRFFKIPKAGDADFQAAYEQILAAQNAAGYLTLVDPEIVPLGELEARMPAGPRYLHPCPATAAICEDKYDFYKHLSRNGLPTIETSLTPLSDFPFIRKDRTGSAASGFAVYHEGEEKRAAIENGGEENRFIYQPFCGGRHLCVDAYFSMAEGKLIDICVKEVISKSNGESYLLRSLPRGAVPELVAQLAGILPMRGVVNFDIYEEEGSLKIMEVNCRIGGNYPASHAFGCNLLRPMLAELFGTAVFDRPSFSDYEPDRMIAKYFEFSPSFPGDTALV